TVRFCPPTAITPSRAPAAAFACAVKLTVPLPLPLAPAVIEIQDAVVVACHVHPVAAVTAICPGPPAGATVNDVGFSVIAHAGPVPEDCVTGKLTPPIVKDPLRAVPPVFAATE